MATADKKSSRHYEWPGSTHMNGISVQVNLWHQRRKEGVTLSIFGAIHLLVLIFHPYVYHWAAPAVKPKICLVNLTDLI